MQHHDGKLFIDFYFPLSFNSAPVLVMLLFHQLPATMSVLTITGQWCLLILI